MNLHATPARVLVEAIMLGVCSPIVLGQEKPQTPPKLQLGNSLQIVSPTRGADFSGYGRELLASIKRNWIALLPDSVKSGQTGIVAVLVQVCADGTLLNPDPKIVRSSNRDALDAAAVAALRASAPFPHFPSGFEGATIELRIAFFYNIPLKKPDPILVPGKSDAGGESSK
jgi:TonB family protein